MAKLTDILGDITQNEMSKRLIRMSEKEINAIPSQVLSESLSKLEEFAGRSAPRKREEQSPEELASINQARANAGLPAIKPKAAPAPAAPAAPIDPAIARRNTERDAELAAAQAEFKALMAQQKIAPKQAGKKTLPSQDRIAGSWSDDAGVDTPPDTRSLTSRKARIPADDEEESYTLEEWMGMLEETGYGLEEGGNAVNKEKKNAYMDTRQAAHGVEQFGNKTVRGGGRALNRLAQPADPLQKKKPVAEGNVENKDNSPEYNKAAVDKAIASSRQKIGKKEASAIHRLLMGRHEKGKK